MLKFALCAALFCCAFAAFSADTAKKGELLPDISAVDENGAEHRLSLYKDKSGLVIFFFPKAFTGGCVCENAGFRDYIGKYNEKGYTILGVSRDEPSTLVKFKQIYRLNYTLLSDPNDELAKALGLHGGKRDTIVIGKDGRVINTYHDVDAPTHHKTLINDLK
jgi:peroxiredoxin Q/BCP